MVDHHAAHADVYQSVEDPAYDARVNVVGMLALSRRPSPPMSASSSSPRAAERSTAIRTSFPATRPSPQRPISPYGASKKAGEVYLETMSRMHGLDYTILRYPNVYGPRQHPYTEEGQVVSLFSRLMLSGKVPTIFGDGEQERDFVYVGDIVDANLRALEAGSRGTFNIGMGSASP